MRPHLRFACLLICLVLALAPQLARAGGAGLGEDDGHHNPDEGPPFWGYVKDKSGKPVADAKVSASYKNSLTLVTRTNAIGAYRVRGFKKEINPADVTITCSKEGYKQVRVFRRAYAKGKPVKSIETECRMERM